MFEPLWLVPLCPIIGCGLLLIFPSSLPRFLVSVVGVGSIAISMTCALGIGLAFIVSPPEGHVYSRTLFTWMDVGGFAPRAALHLDPLSVVMMLVITTVGFLIHIYSVDYMAGEEGYARFFAYMNLFVGMMLILVLADNLLFMYLGWEGVGICSYLLIGFWYKDAANGRAAVKAFVITRFGDTALAMGLFLILVDLGTLQIPEVIQRAASAWPVGSVTAIIAAGLLLGGALGKSAQVPLQTWLPDAMAGPTPVSALIHAATMVTAGVYLIARLHGLFVLAPPVQAAVALIGLVTLLTAACSALAQSDIKRILAYSTMSQIGYMFLALGVGAWSAAIFHFVTHAFFKSLLFLSAGVAITALHHEQNIFKMGGIRRELPAVFWTFVIGAACLASVPLLTSGFYSKDAILWAALSSDKGSPLLWLGGVCGALLTALYTFRVVWVAFLGKAPVTIERPRKRLMIPLFILAGVSLIIGLLECPATIADIHLVSDFLAPVLPAPVSTTHGRWNESFSELIVSAICILGIAASYILYRVRPQIPDTLCSITAGRVIRQWWFSGWGFDRLYETLIVAPFVRLAAVNRNDVIDSVYEGTALLTVLFHRSLTLTQTGRIRNYAAGIAIGAVVTLAVLVLL